MSGETTTPSRSRGGTVSVSPEVKVDPKRIQWVIAFSEAGAEADKQEEIDTKRGDVIGTATVELRLAKEGLAGLDFELAVKQDASVKSRLLALVGKQERMPSLTGTGDAMKEIDTVHDLDQLEPIDPKVLAKAYESLEVVSRAAQEVDGGLMALYAEEFGIEEKDFARLMKLRDDKKRDRADPEKRKEMERKATDRQTDKKAGKLTEGQQQEEALEKELAAFEQLRAKVEKEVRDEVWQPLVREGLVPENFVPDRHSELARTFDAASDLYNQRLEEYTKSLGDNAELIGKLGLAKTITTQTLTVMSAVTSAVPGAESVKDFVETGIKCATILADASFQVAGQVLQKNDALDIAQTVADGVTKVLGTTGEVPPEIMTCVSSGMQIALTGGKAVKGIMDGKPGDIVDAVLSGVTQSLSLAADISGNPMVAMIGKDAAAAAFTVSKAGPLIAALKAKPPTPGAVEDALNEFIAAGLKQVGTAVNEAVQFEAAQGRIGSDDSDTISEAVDISTDGTAGLVGAALSKNKASALAKAMGGIADDCCAAYIPGDYGEMIGGIIKSSLSKAPDLVEGIRTKDPAKAMAALSSALSKSLDKAGAVEGMDGQLALGLTEASKAIKGLSGTITGIEEFKNAVAAGDVAAMRKAAANIINSAMDPVLDKVDPDALDDDGHLVSDEEEDAPETDDGVDPESELGQEMEEAFEAKRRRVMAEAEKIIKNPASSEEEKTKAAKIRDEAVKELLERNAFMEEVAASARDFEALLNGDLEAQDDDTGDLRTLEALVTQIKRDRMIMQMADSLIGMGVGVAAHFFPPMAIAMDLKTFVVEATKAVAHLQELVKWKRNASEARNAVTVQVHSMLNRVGLEEEAVIEHQIKATLALISAIGNIVATAGAHAAPAGLAITAAAKVARTSLDLALTIKSAVEMEMAWNKFKKALANPSDRKNARMAIEENATLAKYALVWGALSDGNPIAKKALKRCGLSDPIIAKEQANVKGVVEYLELLYNDDPVVLKAVPDTSGWGWDAPRPSLELKVWLTFLATASSSKAKPALKKGSGGAITAAFEPLKKAVAEKEKAVAAQERASQALEKLRAQMIEDEVNATVPPKEKMSEEETKRLLEDVEKLKQANAKRLQKPMAVLAKADQNVVIKKLAVKTALNGLVIACAGFKPLDEKDKPYPRISEWTGALAAQAELEARELDGEDVGLTV